MGTLDEQENDQQTKSEIWVKTYADEIYLTIHFLHFQT